MKASAGNAALREQAQQRAAFSLAGLTPAERFWFAVAIVESLRLPERMALVEQSTLQVVFFVEEKRPQQKHLARAAGGMVQIALKRLAGAILDGAHTASVPPASSEGDGR